MLRLTMITILNMLSLYSLARLLRARRRGTAGAHPSETPSTTTASPSAVRVPVFTTPTTSDYLPSAPTVTETGPAGQGSGCAHKFRPVYESMAFPGVKGTCKYCGASASLEWILAPVAAPTTLTSQMPDFGTSVAPERAGATLPSSELSNRWCRLHGWGCQHGEPRPLPPSDEDQLP